MNFDAATFPITLLPYRQDDGIKRPYILITDKKIAAVGEILPILEKVVQTGKPSLSLLKG